MAAELALVAADRLWNEWRCYIHAFHFLSVYIVRFRSFLQFFAVAVEYLDGSFAPICVYLYLLIVFRVVSLASVAIIMVGSSAASNNAFLMLRCILIVFVL